MEQKIRNTIDEKGSLDISDIVEVIEGTVSDMEEFLKENELETDDLERIKKAERAGKNRKTAIEEIEHKIREQAVENRLSKLENELHSSQSIDTSGSEIKVGSLFLEMYEGAPRLVIDTGKKKVELQHYHLQEFLSNNNTFQGPNRSSLGAQLQSPVAGKEIPDQPTETTRQPKNSNQQLSQPSMKGKSPDTNSNNKTKEESKLQEAIKQEAEKEAEQESQDLTETEKLKQNLKDRFNLKEEDLEGKKLSELKELKNKLGNKKELKEELKDRFGIDAGDKDLDELKELKEKLENIEDKKQELLNNYDIEKDLIDNKNSLDELNNLEDRFEEAKNLRNRLKSYNYSKDALEDKDLEELKELMKKIEKKRNISDKLNLGLENGELKNIDLDYLKSLEKEKEERKRLIQELNEEGFSDEKLEKSSTDDLKKLKAEIESKSSKPDKTDKVEEEEIEDIEKQASQDLELLKGAVQKEEDEEKSGGKDSLQSYKESLDNLHNKLLDFGKSGKDEEDEGLGDAKQKIMEKLDTYRDSEDNVKKSIKTAQFMKAYLEDMAGIERELTYREMSEELEKQIENSEGNDRELQVLAKFYNQISGQIYSGNVYIDNVDEVINVSKKLIKGIE